MFRSEYADVPPPDAAGETMRYVAERVAPCQRVRRGTCIDGVPRAASGRIVRRRLRERA